MAVIGISGLISAGGALLGAMSSGGSSSGQSARSEPYAPAQPYIIDNLKDTAALKNYYKQNPFNPQEQASYQNIFGDLDNFRKNMAPGLMDFANNAMGSSYQRQRGGAPGGGGGYGGPMQAAGVQPNSQPRPFSVAPGKQYGLLDFKAQNPYANGAIPVAASPAAPTEQAQSQADAVYQDYLRRMNMQNGL